MSDPIATFQRAFFDLKAVTDKVPAALKRALSGFGAYVRRIAQNSLKYGKGSARPGQVPIVHKHSNFKRKKQKNSKRDGQPASPLKELLFFGYDAQKQSVVVGPVPFLGGNRQRPAAPELLEHGGTVTVNGVTRRYSGNPFMAPAQDKAIKQGKADFKNLITR